MNPQSDHDGKSKTASPVDSSRYPEPAALSAKVDDGAPTYSEISDRAHQIWLEQGQPADSAEQNWLQAERELQASGTSRRLVEQVRAHAGSVQR